MTTTYTGQITPTTHDKAEWARFAAACEAANLPAWAQRLDMYSRAIDGSGVPVMTWDELQQAYRRWLVFNLYPAPMWGDPGFSTSH